MGKINLRRKLEQLEGREYVESMERRARGKQLE